MDPLALYSFGSNCFWSQTQVGKVWGSSGANNMNKRRVCYAGFVVDTSRCRHWAGKTWAVEIRHANLFLDSLLPFSYLQHQLSDNRSRKACLLIYDYHREPGLDGNRLFFTLAGEFSKK